MKKTMLLFTFFFFFGCSTSKNLENFSLQNSESQKILENKELQTGTGILGVIFEKKSQKLKVEKVVPRSSAERAGILPGDIFTKINGENIYLLPKEKALVKLNGRVGDTIHVQIRRGDAKFLEFDLGWEKLFYKYVDYGFGYKHRGWKVMHYNQYLEIDTNEDFEVLGKNWARNGSNIFYKSSKILDADSESFFVLNEIYGKDKKNIYKEGVRMEGINPDSFIIPEK